MITVDRGDFYGNKIQTWDIHRALFSENANSMTVIMHRNIALAKSLINDHARVLHVVHFGIIPSGTSAIVCP